VKDGAVMEAPMIDALQRRCRHFLNLSHFPDGKDGISYGRMGKNGAHL